MLQMLLSIVLVTLASYYYQHAPAVQAFDLSTRRSFVDGASSLLTGAAAIVGMDPLPSPPTAPLRPGGTARYNPQTILAEHGDSRPGNGMIATKLGQSRILAKELSPLQQSPFNFDSELYYPPWMFGEWNVTASLFQKVYPYGTDYLPSKSLLEGSPRNRQEQPGDPPIRYQVRYFSTLASTLQNQFTVNLGTGVPAAQIIQDRAFNAVSISRAYQQLAPVAAVDWDYRNQPGRAVLRYDAGLLSPDLMPLGPRRTEIFWNARVGSDETVAASSSSSSGDATAAPPVVFCCAERCRAVTLSSGSAVAADTETITEFRQTDDDPDHVSVISRIACYLTPNPNSKEGVLWQQVGGKAVAFFDYAMDMRRSKEEFVLPDGRIEERACVLTPRDVVQCY